MRVCLPVLAAFLPLLAVPLHAQTQFEGRIVMEMNHDDGDMGPMEMWIKGRKVRMDMTSGGRTFGMIMDHDAAQMTMIMPEGKMFMQRPMPAIDAEGDGSAKVTRTGKTATVAGHRCEIIRVEDPNAGTAEVCGATDMGNFMMAEGPGARGKAPAWARGMKGFFPLRVTDDKGKTVLEVTEIDPKPVDAAMFTPPAGFKPMAMPGS